MITNNCDVNFLELQHEASKKWCVNNAFGGIVLVKNGDFYETFAGDAIRFNQFVGFPTNSCGLKDGLALSGCPLHSIPLYTAILESKGIEYILIN